MPDDGWLGRRILSSTPSAPGCRKDSHVRRSILGFTAALLLLAAAPLFGLATNIIDDVMRMTRASVDDETIIAFVQGEQRAFEVTADDMIAMTNAHVAKKVVQALLDRSAALKQPPARTGEPARSEGAAQDQAHEAPPPAPPVVVAVPPPPVPDYLADPFWYLPRLDTKDGASAVKPAAQTRPPANPAPPVSTKRYNVMRSRR